MVYMLSTSRPLEVATCEEEQAKTAESQGCLGTASLFPLLGPQSPAQGGTEHCSVAIQSHNQILTNAKLGASLMAQTVKNLPAMQETWI